MRITHIETMSRPITCPALVAYRRDRRTGRLSQVGTSRVPASHRRGWGTTRSWQRVAVDPPHAWAHARQRLDLGHRQDAGPEPWFVLTGDTLFSGGVGRPDLIGAGSEAMLAEQLRRPRSDLTLPDHSKSSRLISGAPRGKGLSGKPGLDHRFRASVQSGASSQIESRVRGLRPGRSSASARDFRGESPAQLDRHMSEMRLGLRENFPQFALLVVLNSFVEPWSAWSEPCCRSWANRSSALLEDRHHLVHRELRCDEGGHQPRCGPCF